MINHTGFIHCPRCGGLRISSRDAKSFTCEECSFTYFHNTAAAVGAFLEYGESLVFTVRNHEPQRGLLDVPGGFVDYHESLEEALLRELREEIGFEGSATSLSYFGSRPNTYNHGGVCYFTTDVYFRCRIEEVASLCPNDEIMEIVIMKPSEVDMDRIAFASLRSILPRYTANGSK